MAEYSLFIPPADLAARPPKEWSSLEADRYREWLLAELPRRTDELLRVLDVPVGTDPSAELAVAGAAAAQAFRDPRFTVRAAGAWRLTNVGYALAADLGLLVARRLGERFPTRLRWETVRRPKRDMSYHLPVLTGFSTGTYLEPVGGSIAEAHAVLRGDRGADAWQRVFTFWSARAEA